MTSTSNTWDFPDDLAAELAAPDAIGIAVHWLDPRGHIVWANQTELDLLGYPREEYAGRHISELHLDATVINGVLERLVVEGPAQRFDAVLRARDGSLRHVSVTAVGRWREGKLVYTRTCTCDLTPLRNAEAEAKRLAAELARVTGERDALQQQPATGRTGPAARARLDEILDQLPVAVLIVDAPSAHFAYANREAKRIFGVPFTRDETVATYATRERVRRLDGQVLEVADYPLMRALKGELVHGTDVRYTNSGGRVRTFRIDATPIRDSADVVVGAVASWVDVSDVQRAADERRQLLESERAAREHAERASRAKDEFLALLGHELRNPLTPVSTGLQLLKLGRADDDARQIEIIERHVANMVRLVDDLLDVSRVTRGKVALAKETVELGETIARAVEIAGPLLDQRRLHLAIDVPAEGVRLRADPARLAQVVANLLTNAAKFTPAEGHIWVVARRDGDHVSLRVRDDGQGIDPQLLPRIFDVFVKGPVKGPAVVAPRDLRTAVEGGIGVGLALVRSLVELHGGTVAVTSNPGEGTEFVITLPADSNPDAPVPVGEQPSAPYTGNNPTRNPRRVLVVDDNEDAADLLAVLLRRVGHEVSVAYDGPQALHAVETFPAQVVVCDIGLPVMDGHELAHHLRKQLGETVRLIAVSGYGQERDRQESARAGFEEHFVKPLDTARLLAAIDR